jgi:hypothetical protein
MDDLSLISDISLSSLTAKHAYILKDVDGQMECLNKKAKDINEINWVSFSDLEKNCSLDGFPYSATRALMSRRYQYFEKKKTGEQYCRNSTRYIANTIMANMAEFEYARVMTHCGTVGFGKVMNTPCGKWKYCDRCADIKRKFFYLRYGDVYGLTTDPCFFITITVDLEDKVVFNEQNQLKVIDSWNKMNLYVDTMYKKKLIKGAIIVEEAAFDSYYPNPVINPHLHVLCVGTDALHTHRFDGMKIHVKTINNHEHWVNELNYMHKCINFFSPYARDWTAENAKTINRNFRDMLNLHKYVVKNRNQSRAIGCFHGKSANSLVKTTKEVRAAFKEKPKKITRQKAKKKIQYNNMFEQFSSGAKNQLKQYREKLAVIEADPSAVDQKKDDTPWWKNPYVLGGGALALGAGAYGAGKLYNGGNNIINDTLGKGVDNYIVNPIKGLFNKPTQQKPVALPVPATSTNPKTETLAPNPETQRPTPQQVQDLRTWLKGESLPSPKIPVKMQSTINAGKTIPTLVDNPEYRAATEKLPSKDVLSPLAGMSPLRPELQKALGQNTTPFEKYYDSAKGPALTRLNKRLGEAGLLEQIANRQAERKTQNYTDSIFGKYFDDSQSLRNQQTRAQQAWNGDDRELSELPEYVNKTPAEIEKAMLATQEQRNNFDKVPFSLLSSVKGPQTEAGNAFWPIYKGNVTDPGNIISSYIKNTGSATPNQYQSVVNKASVPAFAYDMANMASMIPTVKGGITAVGNKTLGSAATSLIGKANPALFPISAGIMNAPSGYRLGQDIANDPTSSYHKLMSSMGVSPENMKYVGSGATAGLAAGGTLLTTQASRTALKGLIARSLASGATAGGSTLQLSPAVAIPAALTTTLASPIADTITQRATAGALNHVQSGDQLSNFHNNLLKAKEYASASNDGSALRGLLNSEYFKTLDTSSQEGIKRLYDSLGTQGGNFVMSAKHKNLSELITSKLTDLLKFNKFKPKEPMAVPSIDERLLY